MRHACDIPRKGKAEGRIQTDIDVDAIFEHVIKKFCYRIEQNREVSIHDVANNIARRGVTLVITIIAVGAMHNNETVITQDAATNGSLPIS